MQESGGNFFKSSCVKRSFVSPDVWLVRGTTGLGGWIFYSVTRRLKPFFLTKVRNKSINTG